MESKFDNLRQIKLARLLITVYLLCVCYMLRYREVIFLLIFFCNNAAITITTYSLHCPRSRTNVVSWY